MKKLTREVVNMVASTQYCSSLDINDVADTLGIEYEQEQFPGMVYRVTEPKVCLLLFRSGKAVALPFDKCEYEPEQFPGLIYRLDEPKAVCLIFSSGKCVITGTRTVEESNRAADLMDIDLSAVLS